MSLYVDIKKELGPFTLDVQFESSDQTLALLGASGSGKSMILKCIAGIVTPDEGIIILNGQTLFDSKRKINLSVQKRRVGYMFQDYALFPNMTVENNIKAGIRAHKDKNQVQRILKDIIRNYQLTGYENHFPHQISGGQKQRVALARMLVGDPQIIMLDEPFSALDAHLRWTLEQDMIHMISKYSGTCILVSHDRDEAYRLSDQIAVLKDGEIDAFSDKNRLFSNPKTLTSAQLTGCKNISPVQLFPDGSVYCNKWGLKISNIIIPVDTQYIGIRANCILPIFSENTDFDPYFVFDYYVTEVKENPFYYILSVIVGKNDIGQPIYWKVGKETFLPISNRSSGKAKILKTDILPLKDGRQL